jgi:glycosyltransferase A (GT-A) superfamily protein (DUF2064 family)
MFAALAGAHGVRLRAQVEGDLGARMHGAFLAAAPQPLLLVGTDCPVISAADLRACARVLAEGADAVFLPAEDGGYGLVGLRRPIEALFCDMVWSTAEVMAQTRLRMRERGLVWREPSTIWDVDLPADLDRLAASNLLPGWEPGLA